MNIDELMKAPFDDAMKDKDFAAAVEEYNKLDERAREISEDLTQGFIEKIMQKPDEYDSTLCMLATAKTLTFLASFLVEEEKDFISMIDKTRNTIANIIFPAMLSPRPCGECEDCKNNHPEKCQNPQIDEDYTDSRFIAVAADQMIEYDIFNKIIYSRISDLKGEDNASSVHDTDTE